MKLIRFALISVFVLVILASAISFLFPSYVLVSRAITIEQPRRVVLPLVSDYRQWHLWVEGFGDTTVKIIDAHTAIVGKTTVKTLRITDSLITANWGEGKNLQTSKIRLIGSDTSHTTILQWQFEQKLQWYPWEKFGSMMNDKILGPMMEKNLQQLKVFAEQRP
ncbi:MAG: hypothetical protein K2X37_07755 [Chitinophagaceae bacterium]|nr:hypothetical protein [Chitinophagaceae bacterium]